MNYEEVSVSSLDHFPLVYHLCILVTPVTKTSRNKNRVFFFRIIYFNFILLYVSLTATAEGRGRRYKQLLDDIEETRGCEKLKEEEQDHAVWRTHFGRDYGTSCKTKE